MPARNSFLIVMRSWRTRLIDTRSLNWHDVRKYFTPVFFPLQVLVAAL